MNFILSYSSHQPTAIAESSHKLVDGVPITREWYVLTVLNYHVSLMNQFESCEVNFQVQ